VKSADDQDSLLVPIWVIGFTGHRHLQHPEKVGNLLRSLIDSLRTEVSGRLVGYSSVAIGADTLFAEACLSSAIPWSALLPRPEDDFKSDFDQPDWEKTVGLLRQATRVHTLPSTKDRDLAYLECGLSTVEESDLMIAVWDGKPSRGTGGTAEVVAHARALAKPLILVRPNSLDVERERFSLELFSDKEMSYLNHVPDHVKGPRDSSARPEERVRQFFQRVDGHAARIAPRVRGWVGASVIMNALAAILTAASIAFVITSKVFATLMFVLVAAATVSVALIKRKEAHRKWIRCRVAAEICRSALATWALSDFATPFWFSQLDGFTRLAKSVRLLHLSDGEKRTLNLDDWRQNYLKIRIDQQLNYFRRRRRLLAIALAILTCSFWMFSALGIGRTILSALLLKQESSPLVSHAFQSFLPIALPLAAGCVLSLVSIFDLYRQVARSKKMEALLKTARSQIEKCENVPSLRRAVEHAENVFAAEVFEWFTLFKYPRFN
jgi:hypothetical protein